MNANTSAKRRTVAFQSSEEVLGEIRGLIDNGHETRGDWTLAQIVEHLAEGNESAFDGFDFTVPWLVVSAFGHHLGTYECRSTNCGPSTHREVKS